MPPVMGIAAFLMAEFLGKDYFDVVARGWVPALIYYMPPSPLRFTLLAIRYRTRLVVGSSKSWPGATWSISAPSSFVVGGLVGLMAAIFLAPMFAALYMFCAAASACSSSTLVSLLGRAVGRCESSSLRFSASSIPIST